MAKAAEQLMPKMEPLAKPGRVRCWTAGLARRCHGGRIAVRSRLRASPPAAGQKRTRRARATAGAGKARIDGRRSPASSEPLLAPVVVVRARALRLSPAKPLAPRLALPPRQSAPERLFVPSIGIEECWEDRLEGVGQARARRRGDDGIYRGRRGGAHHPASRSSRASRPLAAPRSASRRLCPSRRPRPAANSTRRIRPMPSSRTSASRPATRAAWSNIPPISSC